MYDLTKREIEALDNVLIFAKRAINGFERVNINSGLDLLKNIDAQDAVARRIEEVGENVGHLSAGFKHEFPAMPWQQMKNMRNLISHNYGRTNWDLVFTTVNQDFPQLIDYIESTVNLSKTLPVPDVFETDGLFEDVQQYDPEIDEPSI
ncbi:MAG: DUF86 domain-containing protein [Lactobacillaceae bacterium]|nr:DUF86 domain-containing protein [Lactobacillaceae bacterium]